MSNHHGIITEFLQDGYIIRRATKADKQEVLTSFGDVFDGTDYLATDYDNYMDNPNVNCFVGCTGENKIFDFIYVKVIEGGQAAVLGGSRILAQYEGKGYHERLKGVAMSVTMKEYGINRWRITSY